MPTTVEKDSSPLRVEIDPSSLTVENDGTFMIQHDCDPLSSIHPNPKVTEAIRNFEHGEMKHEFVKCNVCMETHPLFHESYNNADGRLVDINNIKKN